LQLWGKQLECVGVFGNREIQLATERAQSFEGLKDEHRQSPVDARPGAQRRDPNRVKDKAEDLEKY
jgi:hypothetical protein